MLQKIRMSRQSLLIGCCVLGMFAAVMLLVFSGSRAHALYLLQDETGSTVLDGSATESVIRQRLLTVTQADTAQPNLHLEKGRSVSITYRGARIGAVSRQETVSQLLTRLGIEPSAEDMIAVDGSGTVIHIEIGPSVSGYVQQRTQLSAPVVYEDAYDLPAGYEELIQSGSTGWEVATYRVQYENGSEVSRVLTESFVQPGDPAVIRRGTLVSAARAGDSISSVVTLEDGSGYLIMASGDSLRYKKAMNVVATAYTTGEPGVGTITASGTRVRVGSIAVDRSVIAMGTNMVVSTNRGTYVGRAEDVGGSIKGCMVDLYMNTYSECVYFGRRSGTVYILA